MGVGGERPVGAEVVAGGRPRAVGVAPGNRASHVSKVAAQLTASPLYYVEIAVTLCSLPPVSTVTF
jgi:hypothetical protein